MKDFLHANWPWLILLALGGALVLGEHSISPVAPISGTVAGRHTLATESTRLIGGVLVALALYLLLRRK